MEHEVLTDLLQRAKTMMQCVHEESLDDLDFWSAESQWNGTEAARARQGRTSYTFPLVQSLIHPIVNVVKQAPPAIKIVPLDGDLTADICGKVASRIRLLEAECKATRAREFALGRAAIGGFGCWRTIPMKKNGKWRPTSQIIADPSKVYPDPNSIDPYFSDCKIVFHEIEASKRSLIKNFPDSEWTEHQIEPDERHSQSDIIKIVECWSVEDGRLHRIMFDDTYIISDETFGDDESGYLSRLPYSFVTGDYYKDRQGQRHYTSIIRFAKGDQVAINYASNEWMSDIATSPKAKYLAGPDAIEDYEDEWSTAHTTQRMVLHAKDPSKLIPIMPVDSAAKYSNFSADHKMSMQQIAGVTLNSDKTLDPVSGKSVRLQLSRSGTSTFHYIDSLNNAVENDGWVYLDQLRVYENNDELRAVMLDDGTTTEQVSFGPTEIPDCMNVDLNRGEFGIQVSTGPSYGSQLEQMQDLIAELVKTPALAGVAPVLVAMLMKRMAIPESEDIVQVLYTQVPPNIQQTLALKGNKMAQVSLLSTQLQQLTQQAQAMQQQLTAQNQQLAAQLQRTNQILESKQVENQTEAQGRIELERIKGENERLLERQRFEQDQMLNQQKSDLNYQVESQLLEEKSGHSVVTTFANSRNRFPR